MNEVKFTNPKVDERVAAWKSGKARFDLSHCNLTSDDLEQLGCDEVVTSRVQFVFMQCNPAEQWIDGIHSLARFTRFKGRELNSHSEWLSGYRRMIGMFLTIRPLLGDRGLSEDELVGLMEAIN